MHYTTIVIAGSYRETAPFRQSPFTSSSRKIFRFDHFFLTVKAIVASTKITRVLVTLEPSFSVGFVSGLESIREMLGQMVDAGKEVWFHATDYTDESLYLASRCTHRAIHPLGSMRCVGLSRPAYFLKKLLDRFDLQVQIARRGKYKSATDRFRLDSMDPYNREQYETWMQKSADTLHSGIAAGYGRPQGDLTDLLGGRVLDSNAAMEERWVESITTVGELTREWKKLKGRTATVKLKRRRRGKQVAVFVIEGAIRRGKSTSPPLVGGSAGAASIVSELNKLKKARSVAAVVLRINSGGGDAAASEDIRVALADLASEKPLLVSMSEVAGSGGYWIATPAAQIFASATTLTGSIGVIALTAALGPAMSKYGIGHEVLTTHPHADARSGIRPLSESEFIQFDAFVGSIYERFLTLVAESRQMTSGAVREVAEGRVWSGTHARERGLVDQIGGLDAAISFAKSRADAVGASLSFHPQAKRSFIQRLIMRQTAGLDLGSVTLPAINPGSLASLLSESIQSLVHTPLLVQPDAIPALLGLEVAGLTGFASLLNGLDPGKLDLLDADL